MPSPSSLQMRRASSAWVALGLIAAGLVLYFRLLFDGKTLYLIDIAYFHYPSRVFARDLVRQGVWPLWNPYICCGFPMHAEGQVSVLYPLNAIFVAPMHATVALSWYTLAHFWLAALGAYALGRTVGISRGGSLLTGLAFGFSGYMTAQLVNVNIHVASAWTPWAAAAALRAMRRGTAGASLALAGVLAMCVLGGHPQTCLYAWVIAALAAGHEWWWGQRRGPARWRRAWAAAWPFALAAGLAAAQILPTWELKQYSPRAEGLSLDRLTEYSLAPKHLLALLLPSVMGNAEFGYLGDCDYFETFTYVGVLPLLLAAAGAAAWRGRDAWFWRPLLLLCLVLALGHYTPLYALVAHTPVLNLFRAPARWLLGVTLAMAVLAGAGWDCMGEARVRGARWLGWVAAGVGAALLLVFAACPGNVLGLGAAAAAWVHELASPALLAREPVDRVAQAVVRITFAAAGCFAAWLAGAAVFLGKDRWPRARWLVLVAGLVVFADLLRVGRWNVRVTERGYFEWGEKLSRQIKLDDARARLCPPDYGNVVLWLRENTPSLYGVYSVKGHFGQILSRRYRRVFAGALESPALLDLMAVRYLLEPERDPASGNLLRPLKPRLVRRAAALPRCYVAQEVTHVSGAEEAWHFVTSAEGRGVRRLCLEKGGAKAQGSRGRCRLVRYRPHEVLIEADCTEQGAAVFLSDEWQPGWCAFVDGVKRPVLLANYAFRAVVAGAGRQALRMVYAPRSFMIGSFISLAAMGFAVLLGFARWLSARPRVRC